MFLHEPLALSSPLCRLGSSQFSLLLLALRLGAAKGCAQDTPVFLLHHRTTSHDVGAVLVGVLQHRTEEVLRFGQRHCAPVDTGAEHFHFLESGQETTGVEGREGEGGRRKRKEARKRTERRERERDLQQQHTLVVVQCVVPAAHDSVRVVLVGPLLVSHLGARQVQHVVIIGLRAGVLTRERSAK